MFTTLTCTFLLYFPEPFHEVKRKREKKKENTRSKDLAEPRKPSEHAVQGMKTSSHGIRRGGNSRGSISGGGREFRVVKDNRINQNAITPSPQCSTFTSEHVKSNASEKGQSQDTNSSGTTGKLMWEKRQAQVPTGRTQVQASKPDDSLPNSLYQSPEGVYSSSSDPVHVPSPDLRSAATVGAIKREFGAVGVRRQSGENLANPSFGQSISFSNSLLGKDGNSSRESFQPFTTTNKSEQPSQAAVPDSVVPSLPISRSFLSNQYSSRQHQQVVGNQKASRPNKEWKPKLIQKSSLNSHGVIGTPAKSFPQPADNPKDLEIDVAQVQDKLSHVKIYKNQNVIIAGHIQVPESDCCQLTFGSLELASSRNSSEYHAVGNAENSSPEPSTGFSASALESSSDETSASKHVDLLDGRVQNSGSDSPASVAVAEHQLHDTKESSSPQNLGNYADIGLVHDSSTSYNPVESQQEKDPSELPSFSAYDPQTVYDEYFRQTMDETVRSHGLPSPQEALSLHTANDVPASTTAMIQQQPPPVEQMYPQVHVPPFANLNLMPYHQILSPVYVPSMPMPGYSGNPTYPHSSNGSSYLLMPGGSSHLTANNLKYRIQHFKPVPAGSPTGFRNFTTTTAYAVNGPGVGSAAGLEESSRLKYKDGNLYPPNPQAETTEVWIQNPRDLPPGLQSASYYNMPGQTPHAATYLPSHTSHASFSAAQSSHMQQFSGLYHPSAQPAAIAGNPHHLGGVGNVEVGVGVAAAAAPPGAQVGAYQQPQLGGHVNWTTRF
ncbi:uncharacterized protein LOC127789925 isoform X2 [Diospyros lotus]|uniref:uncharacterized protein LOC127789925 isoform X2 n=1 Tax=Diospyros lotus TaxID=55363 RepID=UPI00225C1C7E|nr:uncharacterized protein LOC127789925 isoform X2 [Diospyros lotus]